jgi:hypothetical protein
MPIVPSLVLINGERRSLRASKSSWADVGESRPDKV